MKIRENIAAELRRFRAIREKYGIRVPGDEEHLRALTADGRALLAFTSDQPQADWTSWAWSDHTDLGLGHSGTTTATSR